MQVSASGRHRYVHVDSLEEEEDADDEGQDQDQIYFVAVSHRGKLSVSITEDPVFKSVPLVSLFEFLSNNFKVVVELLGCHVIFVWHRLDVTHEVNL